VDSGSPATASARRILNLRSLFAASIGVIVSQVTMVSVLQGMGLGGWGFVVAMLIAFGLALTNAMAYTEMALMMPEVTSLSSYAEAAVGNFPAILLVFAGYVTPVLFGVPGELILMNQVLSQALPFATPVYFWPGILIVAFMVLNILGTDVFARVQTALSCTVLGFLLATGLLALTGWGASPLPAGPISGWPALSKDTLTLGLVALAFWAFVGSEFVTPLVAEAKNPDRDLPRAVFGGLVVIFIAYVCFALGSAFYVDRATLAQSPAPHLDLAIAVYGPKARIWFSILAVLASASLLNTVLAAVPRMICGMAANGQVFPVFKYIHPRFKTPVIAILFIGSLPFVGLIWSRGDAGAILPLIITSSITWLLAYIVAQVSVLVLRYRHPAWRRPFRVPLFPLLPVAAIAGMTYVCLNASPTPEMKPQIVQYTGVVLVLFSIVGALWVKLKMKKDLFEPVTPIEELAHAADGTLSP
jgi:amino acid transporter